MAVLVILFTVATIFYVYLVEKRKKEYIEKLQKYIESASDSEDDKYTYEEAEALMKEFNRLYVKPYIVVIIFIIITTILALTMFFI